MGEQVAAGTWLLHIATSSAKMFRYAGFTSDSSSERFFWI